MNIYFGRVLRKLRLEQNLTQENFADFIGVSFQTISKWERGDTYPDITMLPDIAKFFGVSVDNLLGFDESENEEKIQKIIKDIDELKKESEKTEIIQKAISEFPNDFRIQLRYMGNLMFKNNAEDYRDNMGKIMSLYSNIQNRCTDDPIRFRAKRYMAQFYNTLSDKSESGISFADVQSIVEQMPKLRDAQEFCKCFLYYQHPNRKQIMQETIEEEVGVLHHGMLHFGILNDQVPVAERINHAEKLLSINKMMFDDGNYGKQWQMVMYLYGYLAVFYYESGDMEKALLNLNMGAELAVQFDNLERITTMHSNVFEGKEFDKHTVGKNFNAKKRMVELITQKYPFDDSFRNSREFAAVLALLA